MKKTSLFVLLAICLFGCATKPCEKIGIENPGGIGAGGGSGSFVLPPPMTLEEMATVVREGPKLACSSKGMSVTLTLKGRLDSFRYGIPGLERGSRVCLVGEITEWRQSGSLCHDYVPGADHEYVFGPIRLPKKNHERFTFVFVAGNAEYRWVGVKWIDLTGDCRVYVDENGNMDLLAFTKRE